MTPLSCALLHSNLPTSSWILGNTFVPLAHQDNLGRSYLHLAMFNCLTDTIILTLLKRGASPTVVDSRGRTALYYLMFSGEEENSRLKVYIAFMQALDEQTRKTLVNSRCGPRQHTVLHRAVLRGDLHLVKKMLDDGAELQSDEAGLTPFHLAVAKGYHAICRIFVARCHHEQLAGSDARGRSVSSNLTRCLLSCPLLSTCLAFIHLFLADLALACRVR
jgi:ankyrin repeat protein